MTQQALETLKNDVRHWLQQHHVDAFGVAAFPLSAHHLTALTPPDPCPFTAGEGITRLHGGSDNEALCRAIVIALPYAMPSYQGPTNLARYTWATDYHDVLRTRLTGLSHFLTERVPNSHSEIHIDTTPLPDRQVAYEAGLGFFGKNHCLIHPEYGSYLSIGTLLTSIPLPCDTPLTRNCYGCNRCITACPGQCLGDTHFSYATCKSYLTQKKGDLTEAEQTIIARSPLIFGCDICQEVCPHNSNLSDTPIPEFQTIEPWLDTSTLPTLTNREFKAAYGHRAFAWRGKATLLRNQDIVTHATSDAIDKSKAH